MYIKKNFSASIPVHHITFGNLHLPHFLWLLNHQYSIGPLGGGAYVETKYLIDCSLKERLKSYLHQILNLSTKFNFILYISLKRANKIIVRTEDTFKLIPHKFHHKTLVLLETGVDEDNRANRILRDSEEISTFVNISRFIELKNISVAIETFNYLNYTMDNIYTYKLVGGGPLFSQLKAKYESDFVIFLGKVKRDEVLGILKNSDVMLTCTVKEGGSHAIFEALTYGCLLSCYDISGMRQFPSSLSAIKFSPTDNIENNIKGFAKLIKKELVNKEQYITSAYEELDDKTWPIISQTILDYIDE